ncbi:flagellar biosynthetic protein FliQ [bacterium]|nr:flagellar biosynthetic protein FliQ [bacterium]
MAVIASAVPLAAAMLVGFVISIFQAVTQIQDQTLSYLPKLAAVCLVFFLLGPVFCQSLLELMDLTFQELPGIFKLG